MISEIEERRRKQTIKVAVTGACMLAVVVVLVVFLVMMALGYNFNFGGEVETSGLVQINSVPTGAAITVDGEGMFLPTNQSKTMTSGEHEVRLTRDGYSSWSKRINVREGMLYRLYYPRLYLEKREQKTVVEADSARALATVATSRDRKYMLNIYSGSAEWALVALNDDEPTPRKVDVSKVLGAQDAVWNGQIEVVEWSRNSSKVLVRACGQSCEWILVNLSDSEKSVNLSREFALNFSKVSIASDSADILLSLADGNLRQINVSNVEISKVMATKVLTYSNHGRDVVYIEDPGTEVYLYDDEKPIKIYSRQSEEAPFLVLLSSYYSDDYFSVVEGRKMQSYYGKLPDYSEEFNETMKEVATAELSFLPNRLEVRGNGELVVAAAGAAAAVMDAESYSIVQYEAESVPRWLSEFDMYTVRDGWLTAWDFDNSNPRALIAEFAEDKPVIISESDRFLYYFDRSGNLVREGIR